MNIKSAEIADIILISGFFYQKSSMGDDLNAIWLLRNHVLPGLKDKRDWLNFSKGCPIGKTMVELTMAKTCHAIPIDIVDRLDTSQLHITTVFIIAGGSYISCIRKGSGETHTNGNFSRGS